MPRSLRPRTREQALTLWSFVGTTLALVAGWSGIGFIAAGDRAAQGPSYHVIHAIVPGGIRIHGVLLLLLALGMARTVLVRFDAASKWILRCFAGYAFLVGLSFVGSWLLSGDVAWGAPALWLGIGALAEGMVIFPPDSLPMEEDAPHVALRRHLGTAALSGGRHDR